MSLTRRQGLVAPLTEPASPSRRPEDPESQPPSSKRLCLEEPGRVPEVKWRLPSVPHLSEEEKAWDWPPRPFKALLVWGSVAVANPAALPVERPAGGRQAWGLRRQRSPPAAKRRGRPPAPRRTVGAVRASGRPPEPGPRVREACGGRAGGEGAEPRAAPASGGGGRQEPPGRPSGDAAFAERTEAAFRARGVGRAARPPAGVRGPARPVWAKGEAKRRGDDGGTGVRRLAHACRPPPGLAVKTARRRRDPHARDAGPVSAGGRAGSRPRAAEHELAPTLQRGRRGEAGARADGGPCSASGRSPSAGRPVRHVVSKPRGAQRDTRRNTGEEPNLLHVLDVGPCSEGGRCDAKAVNTRKEPSLGFVTGAPRCRSASVAGVWFSSCSTAPNGVRLSGVSESVTIESVWFCTSVSKKDNLSLWYEALICIKHIDVQNPVTRNMNVLRKNDTLSVCLQASVSKPLSSLLKGNTASWLNNLDFLPSIENDSKIEEGYVFKRIVYLNYLKNTMVENHIVYLGRTSTFPKPLETTMKSMLEKRKLFKTEQVFEASTKKAINSFSMTTKNIHFPILDIHENISLSMDCDDMDKISLTKEISYKSKSCPEQVMNMENWDHCSTNTANIHVKSLPEFTQNNPKYIHEKSYEINIHSQELDTERKLERNKMSSFYFKHIFEDSLNIRQQAMLTSHNTKHSKETNSTIITQVLNFGNLLKSGLVRKKHGLILKEEKATVQNLTTIGQVHEDTKIKKEERSSFYSMDRMFSVQPVSLMRMKINVRNTKYVNQNNLADRHEDESFLQESELAHLKHFHPKNDSTECVNHQFETDLSIGNNECFQDLNAKCLSTEALTIAKDFEMKSKFDLVLEELRMFHEISKENEILSPMETNNGQGNYFGENNGVEEVKMEREKDLKMGTVNKICASSLLCDTTAVPNTHKRHQSLFKWKTVPKNNEQEVPNEYCWPRTSEEELLYSTSEEDCEKPSPKRPAFFSDEFKAEKSSYFPKGGSNFSHGISRVLPLKTCCRPIRIGLSRKAKLKQLHPYLK